MDKYLRPLEDRLEDLIGETESERIIRMEHLDEANLLRLDQTGRGSRPVGVNKMRGALVSAGEAVYGA